MDCSKVTAWPSGPRGMTGVTPRRKLRGNQERITKSFSAVEGALILSVLDGRDSAMDVKSCNLFHTSVSYTLQSRAPDFDEVYLVVKGM